MLFIHHKNLLGSRDFKFASNGMRDAMSFAASPDIAPKKTLRKKIEYF